MNITETMTGFFAPLEQYISQKGLDLSLGDWERLHLELFLPMLAHFIPLYLSKIIWMEICKVKVK